MSSVEQTARYEDVPIAEIHESPLNPRTHYDEHKLDELTKSVREKAAAASEQREQKQREQKEKRWNAFRTAANAAVRAAAAKAPAILPKALFKKVIAAAHLPSTTTPATLQKALLLKCIGQVFTTYACDWNKPTYVQWLTLLGVDATACEPKTAKTEATAKSKTKNGKKQAA